MSLPRRFLIRNVDVWNATGVRKAQDVLVENGLIKKIDSKIAGDADFDGGGRALLPCGIDVQAHLRVPGQAEKELPLTGLRSALRSGYAAVMTMPNTKPVIDTAAVVAQAKREVAEAERQTGVKVFFTGALTKGQEGREPVDAGELKRAGVYALTDDGRGVADDALMLEVTRRAAAVGLPVLQHAEVPGHGAALAPGPTQEKLGIKAYPPEAEWKMVERDLAVVRQVPNARYHVLHVSAAQTVELVRAAKREGLRVTCEVTPHHLWFTSADIPVGDTNFKMNPPLRADSDRQALRRGLADGAVDFASTDHAPHQCSAKGDDFQAAAFGTTAQEATLRVLLSFLKEGWMSPERLVETWASEPAKFLGIDKEYGCLEEGRPFRAVLFDAEAAPTELKVDELESLSKNSCFLGARLPGRIVAVFNDAGLFRF
jgi:dihydroorotase